MTNGIFLRLQLLAVVLTGLVSTKCFGVFCVNTTVEEEQQVYHPFFQSDFSFFGPIPNDSKPPKVNGNFYFYIDIDLIRLELIGRWCKFD